MVRFRNRYLLCAIDFEHGGDEVLTELTLRSIHAAVRSSVELNFGDVGAGQINAGLSVKFWSPPLALAIIRASREHHSLVWTAVTLICAMPPIEADNPVRVTVIHVGATIRACQKAAASYAAKLIADRKALALPVDRLQQAYTSAAREMADMEAA